jgi:CTP:molybdopterin cytidylyltransferase MocA
MLLPGIAAFNQESVLVTIGDKPVYASEFTRILNKKQKQSFRPETFHSGISGYVYQFQA